MTAAGPVGWRDAFVAAGEATPTTKPGSGGRQRHKTLRRAACRGFIVAGSRINIGETRDLAAQCTELAPGNSDQCSPEQRRDHQRRDRQEREGNGVASPARLGHGERNATMADAATGKLVAHQETRKGQQIGR